jgi:predicted esterase
MVPAWYFAQARSCMRYCSLSFPVRFDVYGFDIFTRAEDEPSLLSAVSSVNALITSEIQECGIPPERIIVGGISQGGALACLTGLTSERRFGGVFVLSGYVPLCRKTK